MIERVRKVDKKTGNEYWSVPFPTIRQNIPEKMTTEMWSVYRFIEKRTENGLTTTVQEICNEVPYYQRKSVTDGNYSNCPELYEDVFLINTLYRGQHDKFILTNSNRFKLATKEEAAEKRKTLTTKYYRLNWELEALDDLENNNGQGKLFSNADTIIVQYEGEYTWCSKAKPYKESYAETQLEDMTYDELRNIYRELCFKTGNAPVMLSKELYIKEIRAMKNEIKQ